MGAPVYEGAYMDAAPWHALGAGVTVDFTSTNPSAIQDDNFLAAGLGIHATGCCVDGIDYSYRSDLYVFHNGSELLAASGWEACDNNAACVGHARTLSGSQSFRKAIWRWGEDYPGVSVGAYGSRNIVLAYSPKPAQSFEILW